MEILDKKQESAVIDAIGDAIRMANDGMTPSQAIAKSATDRGYSASFARRMAEAFNVSKSIKFLKESRGDDRTKSFPLANPDEVIKAMYPDEVATPAENKMAEWKPVGTDRQEERYFDLDHAPVKRAADTPETHSTAARTLISFLREPMERSSACSKGRRKLGYRNQRRALKRSRR